MKHGCMALNAAIILAVLSSAGCAQLVPAPTSSPVPDNTPEQPSATPTPLPTIAPAQTAAAPEPSATPEPAAADCTGAKFVSPKANEKVAAGDVSISWEPPGCLMVLQYYQHEKLVDEFFDASSGTAIAIPEPGLTELKIWVSGSSAPSDAVWITVE